MRYLEFYTLSVTRHYLQLQLR